MKNDPNQPDDPDRTQPVEVQRYGPPAHFAADQNPWQAAPAWSTRPPEAPAPVEPRRGLTAAPIVVIAVVAGLLSGALSAFGVATLLDDGPSGFVTGGASTDANTVSDVTIDESSAIIKAADAVAPAVVTIQRTTDGLLGSSSGSGSGFIYDADGFILTNRHVVEGADTLRIVLNDGRQFEGTVYGIDTLTDLAIVTIDATDLPTAPIGNSADLEPGQLAIAIGNPLGNFENTVTTGVVSGLGRQIQASDASQTSSETLNNLIQTDAAINPGNSGGPLVNSGGQVIGVNTAVNTEAQGIGFSIPIDVAKPIMQQAVAGEELARPWIGVYYVPISPALAEAESLPVDYGALIGTEGGQSAVFPGSPAEVAGLQEGDIITAIDGEQIGPGVDLSMLIVGHAPGDTITLRILRDNSTSEVDVTLGELPADR
jgi:S1-C subfamily serine protease